ncbi:MAG TPA: hypothetical protein VF816_18470 [Rhodocyclaceae bacterium]
MGSLLRILRTWPLLGLLALAAVNVPAQAGSRNGAQADPFSGEKWHAVEGSWPGTIEFDAKTRKVVLTPLGAATIMANYDYTAERNGGRVAGRLTMTATNGAVSKAAYRIDGKRLTLQFDDHVEHYRRFTLAEEKAAQQRVKEFNRRLQ